MRETIEKIASDQNVVFNNRDEITKYTTRMRRLHGAGYFMKNAVNIKTSFREHVVFDSVRNPEECNVIDDIAENVYIIVVLETPVDASSEEKEKAAFQSWQRAYARETVTDDVSYKVFMEQRRREFIPEDVNDPALHNIKGCMDIVFNDPKKGFIIINDKDEENVFQQLGEALHNEGIVPFILG